MGGLITLPVSTDCIIVQNKSESVSLYQYTGQPVLTSTSNWKTLLQ